MANDYRAYVECDYNSLYHFGTKGMKWGIRRYQNEDGTLTPEGRRRYAKLIARYKKAGMSDKEINNAIANRRKIERRTKLLAGAAAAGVVGLAAYRGLGGRYFDKTIKAGQKIKTVTMDPELMKKGHFYAAKSRGDANKYVALWGEQKGMFGFPTGEYKKQVVNKAISNVKIASEKNQAKTLKELMTSNKEFRDDLINLANKKGTPPALLNARYRKGHELLTDIQSGKKSMNKLSKKDWKTINAYYNLINTDHSDDAVKVHRAYQNAMKKKGYGGMIDINDNFHSGFHTKSATIVFDNDKFMQSSVKQLQREDIDKAKQIQLAKTFAELGLEVSPALIYSAGKRVAEDADEQTIYEARKRNKKKGGR